MCGFFGALQLDGSPPDERLARAATDLLQHRGPDGAVSLTAAGGGVSVFLGHRRLKIIDLSDQAQQPMPNESGSLWVVFNGEIYNFGDLRAELISKGHRFRSRSDTEVILHAYEEFGEEFVKRLDGMFAFALWDQNCGRLVLARDRAGKKPLFYARQGNRLIFSSEIKSILLYSPMHREILVDAIPELLAFGALHPPRTMYRGVCQLPPGSCLVASREGLREPRRYWKPPFAGERGTAGPSLPEAARQVRQLLTAAVARRMVSDVPLGALLSGGLDSAIIVGIMSRLAGEPVRTFTVGFEDDGQQFDERGSAALAAQWFGTRHVAVVLHPDSGALLERLLWHHDQPYGDSSAVATFLICQAARQQVAVALTGDGGDEVFGGYERYQAALLARYVRPPLDTAGRFLARCLPRGFRYYSLRRRLERFLEHAREPVQRRFIGWLSFFDPGELGAILTPELQRGRLAGSPASILEPYFNEVSELPLLQQLLYVEFMTNLPDDLLVKVDRMAMANSLETRSPMLDTALVEFVSLLPPQWKIRGWTLKYILRRAFRDLLPAELLRKKKHGFAVPLDRWFRRELRPLAEELLLASGARSRDYLRAGAVQALFDEHLRGEKNHGHRLWLVLNFELWLRMIQEGKLWAPSAPPERSLLPTPAVSPPVPQ